MTVAGPGAKIVGLTAGRIVVNTAINAADLISEFSAGAKVYLESDTSSSFASPTVVSSTALASGTEQYEFVDTTGTSSSWYRVRVGNSGATAFTDYSPGVQALQTLAYATIDDVHAAMNLGSDASRDPYLSDLLIAAKDLIDMRCRRTFARNPQISGNGTFTFGVRFSGRRRLSTALGHGVDIQSLATVEIAAVDGGTYSTIASGSTGYFLTGNDGPTADWPYQDLALSTVAGVYTTFPTGNATLRLTGVLGFLTVPELVRRASVDMVREWWRQGPQGGTPSGVNQYGTPMFFNGEPHSLRQLTAPESPYVRRDFAV